MKCHPCASLSIFISVPEASAARGVGAQSQLGAEGGMFPSPSCPGPCLGPRNPPHPFPKGSAFCVSQHRTTYATRTRNRLGNRTFPLPQPGPNPQHEARGSAGAWNSFSTSTSISRSCPEQYSIIQNLLFPQLMVSLAAVAGWERSRGSFPPKILCRGCFIAQTRAGSLCPTKVHAQPPFLLGAGAAPGPAPEPGLCCPLGSLSHNEQQLTKTATTHCLSEPEPSSCSWIELSQLDQLYLFQ